MCTFSFMPRSGGFWLAMNRDEQRTRPPALPPEVLQAGIRRFLAPREADGGTWIAANDAGLALVLLNGYEVPPRVPPRVIGRGAILPRLAAAGSLRSLAAGVEDLPLRRFRPFRLRGFSLRERQSAAWTWDGLSLRRSLHGWTRAHGFSSGFDEPAAQAARAAVCARTPVARRADLHRLHASHEHGPGPFSICMHREDAATVSFTAVTATPGGLEMTYHNGPPCSPGPVSRLRLPWAGP